MGTATNAINALPLPQADRARFVAHIAVADAVCYIFAYAGVIVFLSMIAPALLRIDLRTEALKLEQSLGMMRAKPGVASAWRKFEVRAYRLPQGSPLAGESVAAAEARASEDRLFIHRVPPRRPHHRSGSPAQPSRRATCWRSPARVRSSSSGSDLTRRSWRTESCSMSLLGPPTSSCSIRSSRAQRLRTRRGRAGHVGSTCDQSAAAARTSPSGQASRCTAAICCHMIGPDAVVQRAAARIGTIVDPGTQIDFVVLGLAIFFGGLAGVLLAFPVGNVKIALSTSVGALLAGLAVGALRTRHPLFGRISRCPHSPLMTSLGLAAFVGLTGIQSGAGLHRGRERGGHRPPARRHGGGNQAAGRWSGRPRPTSPDEPVPFCWRFPPAACADRCNCAGSQQLGRGFVCLADPPADLHPQHREDDVGHDHGSRPRPVSRRCSADPLCACLPWKPEQKECRDMMYSCNCPCFRNSFLLSEHCR